MWFSWNARLTGIIGVFKAIPKRHNVEGMEEATRRTSAATA